jgi:hypothetical protein
MCWHRDCGPGTRTSLSSLELSPGNNTKSQPENHRNMKSVTAVLLILALASAAMGADLPSAPHPVEHDPGAWAFTTGFASGMTGTFTKPWIGLAAGVTIGVAANLQDSNHARQNMVGSIAGAVGGYLLIKTLKRDWHRKRYRSTTAGE